MARKRAREKLDKLAAIEKMKSYPFGCTVKSPGLKCAYRALYYSEIIKHVRNHRNSIKSSIRTNARRYEIANETASKNEEDQQARSSQDFSLELNDQQVQNVAIFGSGIQRVVSKELLFKEIDKQIEQKFVLFDGASEEANNMINKSVESLTTIADVKNDSDVDMVYDTSDVVIPHSNSTEQQQKMLSSPLLVTVIEPSKQKIKILSKKISIFPPVEKEGSIILQAGSTSKYVIIFELKIILTPQFYCVFACAAVFLLIVSFQEC